MELPKIESFVKIAQCSWTKFSGSVNLSEASQVTTFVLPHTCLTTIKGEKFVLFDGTTDQGSRMIVFSTKKNLLAIVNYF